MAQYLHLGSLWIWPTVPDWHGNAMLFRLLWLFLLSGVFFCCCCCCYCFVLFVFFSAFPALHQVSPLRFGRWRDELDDAGERQQDKMNQKNENLARDTPLAETGKRTPRRFQRLESGKGWMVVLHVNGWMVVVVVMAVIFYGCGDEKQARKNRCVPSWISTLPQCFSSFTLQFSAVFP